MKLLRISTAAAAMAFGAQLASADTESVRLAKQGRAAWSAFECYTYAVYSNAKSYQRYLANGVAAGREFIDALRAGEIVNDDVNNHTPVGLLWSLSPISTDFSLGKAFANAEEQAKKEINDDLEDLFGDALSIAQKSNAERLYTSSNCELILK